MDYLINSDIDLKRALAEIRPIPDTRLGELLIEEGALTAQQLESALAYQKEHIGLHLGEVLLALGFSTKEQINVALANKLGFPSVTLGEFEITPSVLSKLPADIALQYNVLPLALYNNRLVVAMENPLDWEAMEVLRFNTNHAIEAVITSRADISRALDTYYANHTETLDELPEQLLDDQQPKPGSNGGATLADLDQLAKEAQKQPIVRLVNAIILQGIMHKASDINIRPTKERVNIYYRIDGKLQFSRSLNKSMLAPLVSRIKITGRMDISERRLPQDGHARIRSGQNWVDLRISSIPTVAGESVVIRILDQNIGLKPLSELGLREREHKTITKILTRSNGMFLVTGPTGSGKSTTLYAVLNEIRRKNPHIITVEDPVEYDMDGVEQIQILPAAGYTFAEALRHILRHDPDVVMIGEIRDLETAHIANKAALTGHLVLSTLHTNDATSTVTRLIDMGVEPYLLSSTLLGVMAQRLVRANCQYCLEKEVVDMQVREILGVDENEVFYKGAGCHACNNTGYSGRIAVCELLEVTPRLGQLFTQGANAMQLKEVALEEGMNTLTQNALTLAREKQTSLEEVFAVRLE